MIKEGTHSEDFLTSHLFWVLLSQSSSLMGCPSEQGEPWQAASPAEEWSWQNSVRLWAGGRVTDGSDGPHTPVVSWGSWKSLRLSRGKNAVHFMVLSGFQSAPHKCGLRHTSLINNTCSHILHSSLFFSFCCGLLRTSSLTITSPWTVFRNHSSLHASRLEQGPTERDGWSNKNHLRNYQRNTTQPEEEMLRGKEESYAGKACGASSESSQGNGPNKRMWRPGAYAREG